MPKENKLVIAAAGAGKTTFLINEALKIKHENVLITTYTEANEAEIRKKILKENKHIPKNITIQTWFTFLLKHGIRPYQGSYNDILFSRNISGLLFTQQQSGYRFTNSEGSKVYWGETDFGKYYFTNEGKIYSDKLSKFMIKCNEKCSNNIFDRIQRIYPNIFIDEVQDLAGYDLEILKLLFKSNINTLLVGDPRQVTYLTHHERMNSKYRDGNIKAYVEEKCKSLKCIVDETTLKYSHRNNSEICDFSSRLYPDLPISETCSCDSCRVTNEHTGIFLIKESDIPEYKITYPSLTILRYEEAVSPEWNYGKSKGLGFDRVLIYPTQPIIQYLRDGQLTKTVKGKTKQAFDIAKFYVAITRARYSVAIVCNYADEDIFIHGVLKWNRPVK